MDKILEIEVPNGFKIKALAVVYVYNYIVCYSQNRLFTVIKNNGKLQYDTILVEYCVIPDYDCILKMSYDNTKL